MSCPSRQPQTCPFGIVGTHNAMASALIHSATCKEGSFVGILVPA